jgi:protein-tyrosine phosphatase
MDDGAKGVEESLEMLSMLKVQGIDRVCATPHFYADTDSVGSFLDRRAESADRLSMKLTSDAPQILLGAEVKYYPGISRMEGLEELRLGESRLILLEMPFGKWTEYTLREIGELAGRGDIRIMLAHIDRYLGLQSDDALRRVYESGVLVQANASFVNGFFTRRRAIEMLAGGGIQFIGSDCHNTHSRAPDIGRAYSYVEKKLGRGFTDELEALGEELLTAARHR